MKKEVIVALDFPTVEESLEFLEKFGDEKLFVKIGLELYLQNGQVVVEQIKKLGHKIFLDLKLHDIPNTVYGAAKGLAQFHVDILTVHAAGGYEMLKAAKQGMVDGGSFDTNVIAITQLTSTSEQDMREYPSFFRGKCHSLCEVSKTSRFRWSCFICLGIRKNY